MIEDKEEITSEAKEIPVRLSTGEMLNLSTGEIRSVVLRERITYHYSKNIGEFINDRIAEGKKLSEVCRMDGVPDMAIVMRWLKEYPEFEEDYSTALKARAILSVENIFDIEQDARHADKNAVPGLKLSFEASKFIAERFDRERFSPKSSADVGGINIQINTGITRTQDDRSVEELLLEVKEAGSGL